MDYVDALFCTAIHACSDGLQETQLCFLQLYWHFFVAATILRRKYIMFCLQLNGTLIVSTVIGFAMVRNTMSTDDKAA